MYHPLLASPMFANLQQSVIPPYTMNDHRCIEFFCNRQLNFKIFSCIWASAPFSPSSPIPHAMQAFHLPIGDATRLDPALTTGCGTTRMKAHGIPRCFFLTSLCMEIISTTSSSPACTRLCVWKSMYGYGSGLNCIIYKAKAGQTLSPCLCIVFANRDYCITIRCTPLPSAVCTWTR